MGCKPHDDLREAVLADGHPAQPCAGWMRGQHRKMCRPCLADILARADSKSSFLPTEQE